jgi:hypothetical protein
VIERLAERITANAPMAVSETLHRGRQHLTGIGEDIDQPEIGCAIGR